MAVIVTEPDYSKSQRYQTVVPILSAAEFEEHKRDVRVADTSVLQAVDRKYRESFLWTEAIFSIFHHRDIESASTATLDEATMSRA